MRKDVRNEIIRTGDDNINKSEMARIMGCSRQTIYNREERLKNPIPRKNIVRTSKLEPYKEIIDIKVDKYRSKGMNVYKFIKKQGYTGGYGIVRKYIKEHKNEQIKKATIRFETIPGLQAQVDWKESMRLVNRCGEIYEINIFLMILGYSRYKYIELTSDRNQNILFKCMVNAFGYYNGCPREILFDNMRTVVDKARTTTTEVVFNKRFQEFSNDAGFTPLARTKEKYKVKNVNIELEHEVIDDSNNKHIYKLNFTEESSGTRVLFALAPFLKRAFETTKVVVVDELERSMHPALVEFIVKLFNNKEINKSNSQLIFATHATNLLNLELLRRDQIWFTEKNPENGVSDLYPLDSFSVRKDENIQKGYVNGRYGAIPFIRDFDLWLEDN